MTPKSKKLRTIYIKFAAAVIALILLQSVIYTLVVTANNVVNTINRNSEDILKQYAGKRSVTLETNFSRHSADLLDSAEIANQLMTRKIDEKGLNAAQMFDDPALLSEFTEEISAELLEILHCREAASSFIVLCSDSGIPDQDSTTSLKGVYFTDTDMLNESEDHSDIIMLKGSSIISSKYNIPLDIKWSADFSNELNEISDLDFFFKAVNAAHSFPNAELSELGFWSPYTEITDSGSFAWNVIHYSVPLICDGQVYGVIGAGIYADSINELLPYSEISKNGTGEYILVHSHKSNRPTDSLSSEIQTVSGNVLSGSLEAGNTLKLSKINGTDAILSMKGVKINGSNAYCAASPLNLYGEKSPYSNDQWLMLAAVSEEDLFETSGFLTSRLTLAAVLSFSICGIMAVILTILVLKPVSVLCTDAENISESSSSPKRQNLGTEFNELSSVMHELSTERNRYIKEINSEKERHHILLKAARCHIFEYDCTEDSFIIYRLENNIEKHSIHHNYRSLVIDGKVCPEEDIPLMLDFTEGRAEEEFRIRIYERNGEVRWKNLVNRPVINSDGVLVRIVACSFDINDEKLLEEKRAANEHIDKVTGFYSNEYGRMLVKKSIIENPESPYNVTIFALRNVNDFIQLHGMYYFDGIIEEIGNILRMFSTSDDIIWRRSISQIAVYTHCPNADTFRSDVASVLEYVCRIYCGEEEENFICQAGISENEGSTSLREAVDKAVQAQYAAEMPIYPDICYYTDIAHDADTHTALIIRNSSDSSADHNMINSGFIVTDNIISYCLNMLEKSKHVIDALKLIFTKTGYALDLDRIAMYEINEDFLSVNIFYQWCRYELEPVTKTNVRMDKNDFDVMVGLSANKEILVVESDYLTSSQIINDIVNEFRSNNRMIIIPTFDKGKLIGCISASLRKDTLDEITAAQLKEISKITFANMLKSKNSNESKAKSDFLSSMSHEIRTPMNAIMGMTAIALRSDELSADTRDCLNKIDSSSKYLLELINDILDMSRIESGKITVENAYLNMNDVIGQADVINRSRIEEKGNRFTVDCRISEPYLIGDSMKLRQVLVNILGNAAKFTENGSITLSVTQEKKKNSDMTFVRFSVRDTGIGISDENLSRIFNAFEQADASTSRKFGGTGLGLSISSSYVRLMGGRLEVKSELGKGSEFYFTLPMRKASPSEIPDSTVKNTVSIDFTSKRVLLAEDDELNTEIAKTLLEADGLIVETAADGKEALDMYLASGDGYYDVILMDIRMPVMDGLEAAKQIRRSDRKTAASVPIIAMTANAFDEDMKKSVECGMNGHLSKPIDMNRIREVLTDIWSS